METAPTTKSKKNTITEDLKKRDLISPPRAKERVAHINNNQPPAIMNWVSVAVHISYGRGGWNELKAIYMLINSCSKYPRKAIFCSFLSRKVLKFTSFSTNSMLHVPKCQSFSFDMGKRNSNFQFRFSFTHVIRKRNLWFRFRFLFSYYIENGIQTFILVFFVLNQ